MGVIKRQGISNAIVNYIGLFIGFVNIIFIQPHYLKAEELGLIRVLFAFASIVAMALPLGIGNITVRYFPLFRDTEKRHHGFFMIVALFTLIGFLLVGGLLLIFRTLIVKQYEHESALFAEYFFFSIPLALFVALNAVFSIYCQALFRSVFSSLINDVISRILTILLVVVYFNKLINFEQFVYGFVGIYLLMVLAQLVYIHIIDRPGYRIDAAFFRQYKIKSILRYGFLMAFTAFASLGIKLIDSVILGHYVPLALVGVYSVAAFIPNIIEAPLGALERISNTKIADEWTKGNTAEILKIYIQSTRYLTLLGGFLFVGITINIDYLFDLLPRDFHLGIPVVLILSTGTLVNMITGLNGSILFTSRYYIWGTYLILLLMVMSVVNCIIFIPIWGITGAAFAIMLSSLVYNLLKFFFIWKLFGMQPFDRKFLQSILVIGFSYLAAYVVPEVKQPIVNMITHSLVILVVFGGSVILLNIVPEFHRYLPWVRKKAG